MKRLEKICAFILAISVIVSIYFMVQKIMVETNNNKVEISVPATEVHILAQATKVEPEKLLLRFKQAGLTSLAIQETTLRDMVNAGRAMILNGWQLMDHQRFLGITADIVENIISDKDFNPVSYYVFTKDKTAFELLKEFIPKRGYEIRTFEGEGLYVIQEVKGTGGFSNIGLGFDQSWLDMAEKLGLNVDIYTGEMQPKTKEEIEFLLSNLQNRNVSVFIAQNNQLPKDPEARQTIVSYLKQNSILLGIDEFVKTDEIAKLAKDIEYKTVRVYNRPLHKWMDEYLLAVRDRNDRLLYLHLFLSGQDDLVSYNEEHISEITDSLKTRGIVNDFMFSKAESFNLINGNVVLCFIASLGILWALIRLFILAELPERVSIIIAALGLMGMIAVSVVDFSLYRDLSGLAVAVIFPVVALYGEMKAQRSIEEKKYLSIVRTSAKGFIKATLIATIGAFLLWGICADTEFLLGIEQFRGIKLLYILSYVLIIILVFKDKHGLSLRKPIFSIGSLLLFCLLGAIFYVLINRTGNFSTIPIPKWEIYFRIWLENTLLVRPRTKEFLIGFPALILAEGLRALGMERYSNWFYLSAMLGLVSMVNTFTHFHISSLISIIRSLEGVLLGMMIGVAVLGGLYIYEKRRTKYNA